MPKKKKILWLIVALNALCLPLAFYHNTWNYGDKWNSSPIHSLWEFFTVWWCVWNSVLLFIWVFGEINSSSNKLSKKNGKLGLLVVTVSLTSIIGFTLNILAKIQHAKSFRSFIEGSWWLWWVYSFTWHYIIFPLALYYFFKYSKPENLSKRKILYLTIPFPVAFLLANLARNFLADSNYFGKKPFLGNVIWWFSHLKNNQYELLLAWIAFSIFYFWIVAYLLLRFKKWLDYSPKLSLKYKIIQQKMKIRKEKDFLSLLKKNPER